jgi:hypothetical protein
MSPIDQILYCHEQFKNTGKKQRGRWITFRKELGELDDIIERSAELYPAIDPVMGIGGWTKMEKRWRFSSGYTIDFRHLDGPDDHRRYNGKELSGLGFDQVEEIPEEVYLFLAMQVRAKDDGMKKLLRIVSTTNPGGPHSAWVKKYFYTDCMPHNTIHRRVLRTSVGPREITKAFIPAKLSDNKYLHADGAYEANLMRMPEHMRRQYLDGDWDVVPGAYFGSIWSKSIHVIPSFPIPGAWPVKGGIDWGSTAPASCHFAAKDNDGNIYFIDELYGPGITGRTFGEKIAKKFVNQRWSAEKKYSMDEVYFLIDRQAKSNMGGDGRWASAAAGIASHGVRLFDANKDRASRCEQWTERLIPEAKTGKPRVFIFGDRCPNLARIMPQLPTDKSNPEDIDHDAECHAYDSSGFVLMDWPLNTAPVATPANKDRDVERWLELARKRRAMAGSDEDDAGIHAGYGD